MVQQDREGDKDMVSPLGGREPRVRLACWEVRAQWKQEAPPGSLRCGIPGAASTRLGAGPRFAPGFSWCQVFPGQVWLRGGLVVVTEQRAFAPHPRKECAGGHLARAAEEGSGAAPPRESGGPPCFPECVSSALGGGGVSGPGPWPSSRVAPGWSPSCNDSAGRTAPFLLFPT